MLKWKGHCQKHLLQKTVEASSRICCYGRNSLVIYNISHNVHCLMHSRTHYIHSNRNFNNNTFNFNRSYCTDFLVDQTSNVKTRVKKYLFGLICRHCNILTQIRSQDHRSVYTVVYYRFFVETTKKAVRSEKNRAALFGNIHYGIPQQCQESVQQQYSITRVKAPSLFSTIAKVAIVM